LAAKAEIPKLAEVKHLFVEASARLNNRAENSHQPARERERRMRGFRGPKRTQAFLSITLDGYAASHRTVREMNADQFLPADTTWRSSKYLNNLIEQDHRNIKSRVNAMLGFKRFRNAAITISGVELMHRIRKGQFNLTRLCHKDITAPAVWKAVLSAR
jgi:transposase-like protein